MAFRVYVTNTAAHSNGFFQAKGENKSLKIAVATAMYEYYLNAPVSETIDSDFAKLSNMMESIRRQIQGKATIPAVSSVNCDHTLCVEIFR